MYTRRDFLFFSTAAATAGLLDRPRPFLLSSGTDLHVREFRSAVDALTSTMTESRRSQSFEAAYASAVAVAPALPVQVGTALKLGWEFLKEIGSTLIANGISDWMQSLAKPAARQVAAVDEMLTSMGFVEDAYSRVYQNGQTNIYIRTDEFNAEICCPFIMIGSNGRPLVQDQFIPMIEGPEAIGLRLATAALARKNMPRVKRMRTLLPLEGENYPDPPTAFFNESTIEPAVFETPDGYCATDYRCDDDLKQGMIRVLATNPKFDTTYQGSFPIDYNPIAHLLSDRAA